MGVLTWTFMPVQLLGFNPLMHFEFSQEIEH